MIILVFGGQKSGKTLFAETLALSFSKKPIYIATYKLSDDKEMQKRVKKHQKKRKNFFTKETQKLKFKQNKTYLVDSLTIWLLYNKYKKLKKYIKQIPKNTNVIFVADDINKGVIPISKYSRKFIDKNSKAISFIAKKAQKVYKIEYGLKITLK